MAIQEYSHTEHLPPKSELVKQTIPCEDGFLIIPNTPGIGIELAPDAREKYPPVRRTVGTRLHVDGSVVDQ
jgi:galactonate dehydratase